MKYVVLPEAQRDLDAIDQWVETKFGTLAAERAISRLYAAFELLADFPGLGIERPSVTTEPVRFFALGWNWIVYEPASPVYIYRVVSGRMRDHGPAAYR